MIWERSGRVALPFVIALGSLLLSSCLDLGNLTPTIDAGAFRGDASTRQQNWDEVELARSGAKPLDKVPIEGLPEGVELEDVQVEVSPTEKVDYHDGTFRGVSYRGQNDQPKLVVPYLGKNAGGEVEVVLTDGEHRSDPLSFDVGRIQSEKGAFARTTEQLEKMIRALVAESPLSERELRERLSKERAIDRNLVPLAVAYHLVADPSNPDALINRDPKPAVRRKLDAIAARANLPERARKARDAITRPYQELDSHGSGGSLMTEPPDISTPGELSENMQKYHALRNQMESYGRFAKVMGVTGLILGLPLTGAAGVATGSAAAGLQVLNAGLNLVGPTLTAVGMMDVAKLAHLPCCIETIDGSLSNGPTVGEDASKPQVAFGSVKAGARSQGIDLSEELLKRAKKLAAEGVAKGTGEYFAAVSRTEVGAEVSSHLSSAAAKKAWNDGIERIRQNNESSDENSSELTLHTWNVPLHNSTYDGDNWLVPKSVELGGKASMLAYEGSLSWKLRDNAYEVRRGIVRIQQDPNKFPVGVYSTLKSETKEITLKNIDVAIPPGTHQAGLGEKKTLEVRVRHAEDTAVAPVEFSAGTMIEQVDTGDDTSNTHEFTWKAPSDKSKFPVQLQTKSLSDEGLRGDVDEPPPRRAVATVYRDDHVEAPGIPCIRTGASRTVEATYAPKDANLGWRVGAGNLSVRSDTHAARYEAPDSETTTELEVFHRKHPEDVRDTARVRVREQCLCKYHVEISGYVDEFRDTSGSNGLIGTHDKRKGNVTVSYRGKNGLSILAGGVLGFIDEFERGKTYRYTSSFTYNIMDGRPPSIVAGGNSAGNRLKWYGDLRARLNTSGVVKVCEDGCPDGEDWARFEATFWAPFQQYDGSSFRRLQCDGTIVDSELPRNGGRSR